MSHHYGKGVALASLGTFFYAFLGLSIKVAGAYADIWQIMVGRGIIGAVVIALLAHCRHIPLSGGNWRGRIVTGAANFGAAALVTVALTTIPIFEALILWYIFPAWTTLLSWRFLKVPLTPTGGALVALALVGVTIMLWPDGSLETSGFHWGHLAGLGSSLCAASAFVLMRKYADQHAVSHFFYFCVFSVLVSCIPVALFSSPILPSADGTLGILAVALFGCVGQVIIYSAIAYIPPANVAIITMGEIFISAIVASLFLGEKLTVQILAGGSLVIFSGLALNIHHVLAARAALRNSGVKIPGKAFHEKKEPQGA